jgi:hypothetical protein
MVITDTVLRSNTESSTTKNMVSRLSFSTFGSCSSNWWLCKNAPRRSERGGKKEICPFSKMSCNFVESHLIALFSNVGKGRRFVADNFSSWQMII